MVGSDAIELNWAAQLVEPYTNTGRLWQAVARADQCQRQFLNWADVASPICGAGAPRRAGDTPRSEVAAGYRSGNVLTGFSRATWLVCCKLALLRKWRRRRRLLCVAFALCRSSLRAVSSATAAATTTTSASFGSWSNNSYCQRQFWRNEQASEHVRATSALCRTRRQHICGSNNKHQFRTQLAGMRAVQNVSAVCSLSHARIWRNRIAHHCSLRYTNACLLAAVAEALPTRTVCVCVRLCATHHNGNSCAAREYN